MLDVEKGRCELWGKREKTSCTTLPKYNRGSHTASSSQCTTEQRNHWQCQGRRQQLKGKQRAAQKLFYRLTFALVVPVQPPCSLPITHCPQMAHQQPRAALVQLQQSIHESQVLLLGCRPSPASHHTGEGSQGLQGVPGKQHTLLSAASKKGERRCSTLGS